MKTEITKRPVGDRSYRWITGAVVVVTATLLTACDKPKSEAPKKAMDEAVPVTVATVETIKTDRAISIVGTLFPKDEATICAEVEGRVEKTRVDFGDRLETDQDLAQIDTTTYEALARQAAANLAKARATATNNLQNLTRVRELHKSGIASPSDLDSAVAQANQSAAEVAAFEAGAAVAQLNVSRSRVRAPFGCAVTERLVGAGDFVHVGTPLFHVVNDKLIKYITSVPERFAGEVKKDQLVLFTVDAYPGQTFEGRVLLISPSVTTRTRAFAFGALVKNEDLKLKANSFARGDLILERGVPVLTVPTDAIINFSGNNKVFTIENGTARLREVQVGKIKDGRQQILEGLKAGDSVVLTGQSKLRDGLKVAIKKEPVAATKTAQDHRPE